MLVTTDFFDDLMIRHFRFDHETLQQRRDEALVSAAKHLVPKAHRSLRLLITALENASQRADALAYELQDYVQRIEEKNKSEQSSRRAKGTPAKPAAKRKAKAKAKQ